MIFLEDQELPPKLRLKAKKKVVESEPPKEEDATAKVLLQMAAILKQMASTPAQVLPVADPEVGESAREIADRISGLAAVFEKSLRKKQPPKTWRFEVNRNQNGLISGITAKQAT